MKFEDMVKNAELDVMRSRFRDRYARGGLKPEYYGTIRINPADAAKIREEIRQEFDKHVHATPPGPAEPSCASVFKNPFPKFDDIFTVQPFSRIPSGSIFFWEYKYGQDGHGDVVEEDITVDEDEHAGMVQNPITGEWKWL